MNDGCAKASFATWLIARHRTTEEVRFLAWVTWTIDWFGDFDGSAQSVLRLTGNSKPDQTSIDFDASVLPEQERTRGPEVPNLTDKIVANEAVRVAFVQPSKCKICEI